MWAAEWLELNISPTQSRRLWWPLTYFVASERHLSMATYILLAGTFCLLLHHTIYRLRSHRNNYTGHPSSSSQPQYSIALEASSLLLNIGPFRIRKADIMRTIVEKRVSEMIGNAWKQKYRQWWGFTSFHISEHALTIIAFGMSGEHVGSC